MSMDKYVDALNGGIAMPANMLRESVQSMKKIEDSFETRTRKLHIAVLRKDPELMSEALDAIEAEVASARELLEKVKQL